MHMKDWGDICSQRARVLELSDAATPKIIHKFTHLPSLQASEKCSSTHCLSVFIRLNGNRRNPTPTVRYKINVPIQSRKNLRNVSLAVATFSKSTYIKYLTNVVL
jgi:hypothetical protein